jgi:hypothetical protein
MDYTHPHIYISIALRKELLSLSNSITIVGFWFVCVSRTQPLGPLTYAIGVITLRTVSMQLRRAIPGGWVI